MSRRAKLALIVVGIGVAVYVLLSIPILLAGGCGIYC